jgi:hypothetical protein
MESKQLKWIYLVGLALIWEFIYFKGIDWISSTGWFFTDYFCCFFITDWFQKFVKDSKRKWKFIAMTSMFGTLSLFFSL